MENRARVHSKAPGNWPYQQSLHHFTSYEKQLHQYLLLLIQIANVFLRNANCLINALQNVTRVDFYVRQMTCP